MFLYIKTILLIYFTVVFSYTILPYLSIFSAIPNIILAVALIYIFQNNLLQGLLWAVLGGFLYDIFGIQFPVNIFITTVLVLLAWFLAKRFFETSNVYIFGTFCFLASFLISFVNFFAFDWRFMSIATLSALYTTLLAIIINYYFFRKKNAQKIFPILS